MKTFFRILLRGAVRFGDKAGIAGFDARTTDAMEGWLARKDYLDSEDTMQDVARRLGITGAQLAGYCRRIVGKPFLSWRKELRMREACRLMREEPDTPLYIIGEMVGVKDKSNFRRQFREVMKMSPAEWKKCGK